MKQLILGAIIGSLLTTGLAVAGDLYNSRGQYQAPKQSQQTYNYFRERQQQLDIGAMRRQADQDRATGRNPCQK